MSKLDNYIYHKITLATYELYEKYNKISKSKGVVSFGYGFNGYCQSISFVMKRRVMFAIPNKKDDDLIKKMMDITISYVNDLYGINDSRVGEMTFDFFHDDLWVEWAPIVTNTKRCFGV